MGVTCVLAVAWGVLTGCGDDGEGGDGGDASPSASEGSGSPGGRLTDDQRERKRMISASKVSYRKALAAATHAVRGTEPVKAELDSASDSGDRPRWETEVATARGVASTVLVDAVSGKAQKPRDAERESDDRDKLADRLREAKVTPEQAARTALDKKGGSVSAVELDDNDAGKVIWSVDVVTPKDWTKTTFDIDAATRKVLREHTDRD
ncbi:hypothetical protein GCM10009801_74530 [Streptomyces albiaxialis]|uniref:PepSY domain-containing protein n=1 Tax=Streptomyces albiaxialis TaxID=329523 RepID=A0ABN2WXZ1_9ACTN